MANEVAIFGYGGSGVSAGTTRYYQPGGAIYVTATESQVQVKFRNPGTLSKLWTYVGANSINTGTSTFVSRIDGVTGNLSVSIAAGATGAFSDDSNSDSISSGQKVSIACIASGASGSLNPYSHSSLYTPSTNYRGIMMSGSAGSASTYTVNTTRYAAVNGSLALFSAVADSYLRVYRAGTWRNLQVNVSANTVNVTTSAKSYVNGATGGQTVSITASTTGWFEDNSGSDSLSASDLIAVQFSSGAGTGTLDFYSIYSEMDSSAGFALAAINANGATVATSTTKYIPLCNPLLLTSGETYYARIPFACTARRLRVQLYANTISATSTAKSRINLADGSQSASITASTTGWFEDSSGTDSVSSGDRADVSVTGGASGTSIGLSGCAMDFDVTVSIGGGGGGFVHSQGYSF